MAVAAAAAGYPMNNGQSFNEEGDDRRATDDDLVEKTNGSSKRPPMKIPSFEVTAPLIENDDAKDNHVQEQQS